MGLKNAKSSSLYKSIIDKLDDTDGIKIIETVVDGDEKNVNNKELISDRNEDNKNTDNNENTNNNSNSNSNKNEGDNSDDTGEPDDGRKSNTKPKGMKDGNPVYEIEKIINHHPKISILNVKINRSRVAKYHVKKRRFSRHFLVGSFSLAYF